MFQIYAMLDVSRAGAMMPCKYLLCNDGRMRPIGAMFVWSGSGRDYKAYKTYVGAQKRLFKLRLMIESKTQKYGIEKI